MIKLRELRENDAPLMLECLHDSEVQKGLKKRMMDLTLEDAVSFINKARTGKPYTTGENLHYAIADDETDQYLGTVSLKNLDMENATAEYAIITRKQAQGSGAAFLATGLILDKAFNEIGIHRVYLSVYSNNIPAIKLYEKSGFKYEGEFRDHFIIDGKHVGWKWYGILKEEYNKKLFSFEQC